MSPLGLIVPLYGLALVAGVLFWAWRNSAQGLYLSRGLPPGLLEKIPPLAPQDRLRAFAWGIPVLAVLFLVPLGYSLWAKLVLGESFVQVVLGNLTLLGTFSVLDLLVVDWLVLCLLTPRFFVVPGTEGDPGYKDYAFHLRAAIRGVPMILVVSLVLAGIAELSGLGVGLPAQG